MTSILGSTAPQKIPVQLTYFREFNIDGTPIPLEEQVSKPLKGDLNWPLSKLIRKLCKAEGDPAPKPWKRVCDWMAEKAERERQERMKEEERKRADEKDLQVVEHSQSHSQQSQSAATAPNTARQTIGMPVESPHLGGVSFPAAISTGLERGNLRELSRDKSARSISSSERERKEESKTEQRIDWALLTPREREKMEKKERKEKRRKEKEMKKAMKEKEKEMKRRGSISNLESREERKEQQQQQVDQEQHNYQPEDKPQQNYDEQPEQQYQEQQYQEQEQQQEPVQQQDEQEHQFEDSTLNQPQQLQQDQQYQDVNQVDSFADPAQADSIPPHAQVEYQDPAFQNSYGISAEQPQEQQEQQQFEEVVSEQPQEQYQDQGQYQDPNAYSAAPVDQGQYQDPSAAQAEAVTDYQDPNAQYQDPNQSSYDQYQDPNAAPAAADNAYWDQNSSAAAGSWDDPNQQYQDPNQYQQQEQYTDQQGYVDPNQQYQDPYAGQYQQDPNAQYYDQNQQYQDQGQYEQGQAQWDDNGNQLPANPPPPPDVPAPPVPAVSFTPRSVSRSEMERKYNGVTATGNELISPRSTTKSTARIIGFGSALEAPGKTSAAADALGMTSTSIAGINPVLDEASSQLPSARGDSANDLPYWKLPGGFLPYLLISRGGSTQKIRLIGATDKDTDPTLKQLKDKYGFGADYPGIMSSLHVWGFVVTVKINRETRSWKNVIKKDDY